MNKKKKKFDDYDVTVHFINVVVSRLSEPSIAQLVERWTVAES